MGVELISPCHERPVSKPRPDLAPSVSVSFSEKSKNEADHITGEVEFLEICVHFLAHK